MKKEVRVAAVQMDIKGMDSRANLDHMRDLIEEIVREENVDLIVFPELANSGYVKPMDISFAEPYIQLAERIPGEFTKALSEETRTHGVHIVAGILEAHPTIPFMAYNSAVLIDSAGEVVGIQRKMHILGKEKHYFCPGSTSSIFPTELGNIGMIICAEGSFPELSRILALKGVEIICCCYNVPKFPGMEFMNERVSHIAACRAIENMCFFVGCNRVGSDAGGSYWGRSAIAGPMGQLLAHSEAETEGILKAILTEEMFRKTRISFGYFMMRQPRNYTLISEFPV
jgi:predicted amidohydrolase